MGYHITVRRETSRKTWLWNSVIEKKIVNWQDIDSACFKIICTYILCNHEVGFKISYSDLTFKSFLYGSFGSGIVEIEFSKRHYMIQEIARAGEWTL